MMLQYAKCGIKENRGQLKIKQMSFMLLALVLFFVIAGLFFLVYASSNLKKEATILNKQEAIALAARLAGTPEFSCGKAYCIDTDKLMALRNQEAYKGFWKVESIEVWKLSGKSVLCTLENYPNCDVFKIVENKKESKNIVYSDIFVALCRKKKEEGYTYDKCELGKLLVGYKVE